MARSVDELAEVEVLLREAETAGEDDRLTGAALAAHELRLRSERLHVGLAHILFNEFVEKDAPASGEQLVKLAADLLAEIDAIVISHPTWIDNILERELLNDVFVCLLLLGDKNPEKVQFLDRGADLWTRLHDNYKVGLVPLSFLDTAVKIYAQTLAGDKSPNHDELRNIRFHMDEGANLPLIAPYDMALVRKFIDGVDQTLEDPTH
jgi:hypothetical protein